MATVNQINLSLSGEIGTGSFVGATSPTLVTPILGAANATSINFGGTALANYVTGTWTPVFTFSTLGDLSVVYTTQTGNYTRIGRQVFLDFLLVCTPTYTTASGTLRITGLPLTPAQSFCSGEVSAQSASIAYGAGFTNLIFITVASSAFLQISKFGTGILSAALSSTGFTSGVQITLGGSLVYNL